MVSRADATDRTDLKVLFARAELSPLARVGGLAEAAAGLVAALRRSGVTVDLVMPDYFDIEMENERPRHTRRPRLGTTGIGAPGHRRGCRRGDPCRRSRHRKAAPLH